MGVFAKLLAWCVEKAFVILLVATLLAVGALAIQSVRSFPQHVEQVRAEQNARADAAEVALALGTLARDIENQRLARRREQIESRYEGRVTEAERDLENATEMRDNRQERIEHLRETLGIRSGDDPLSILLREIPRRCRNIDELDEEMCAGLGSSLQGASSIQQTRQRADAYLENYCSSGGFVRRGLAILARCGQKVRSMRAALSNLNADISAYSASEIDAEAWDLRAQQARTQLEERRQDMQSEMARFVPLGERSLSELRLQADAVRADARREIEALESNWRYKLRDALLWWWHHLVPWLAVAILIVVSPFLRRLVAWAFSGLLKYIRSHDLLKHEERNALQARADQGWTPGDSASVGVDDRSVTLNVKSGQDVWVRNTYVRSSRGGGSGLLYSWRYPFTSLLTGLYFMTRFQAKEGVAPVPVKLSDAGPMATENHLVEVQLTEHPGFVVRPTHLVAISRGLHVRSRWQFRWISLFLGEFRHILVSGTGTVVLQGFGGVKDEQVSSTSRIQTEPSYVVAWDAHLVRGVIRNENAAAYLFTPGRDLVEASYTGDGVVLTELRPSAVRERKSPIGKVFDAFFSALGKVLGF